MILDQYGKEMKSQKPIMDEVAIQTVRDRYASYPSQGLTPQRLATIFKEADQGDVSRQAELFEEMEEKDLHLGGVLQTRKLAVTGLEWDILPASDSAEDKKIATAAAEMMEYIENAEDFFLDALDAIGKGFAVQEIMWEMSEGQIWIKEINWIHQKRFTFNSPTILLKTPKLLTDDAPVWGEDLPPNKFVIHKYKARSGATPRSGILRPCGYMFLFKNFDIKDWVIHNELFGVPMRVGKYKSGADNEEKEALKRAVFNLGVDAAAVISDDTIIELLESSRRGDAGTFENLAEFCDKAISKGVLGHTGSAEGTPGKLGGENQAKEVRRDLTEADAKALQKTIKFQVLQPWTIYNYGPDKGIPKLKFHFEAGEDLERVAKVYGILVKEANFRGIPEDHIHERFAIPKAKPGEKTLQAAAMPQPTDTQANKQTLMVNAGVDPTDKWVAFYLDRLGPLLQTAREEALDEVDAWLRSLSSPPAQEEFVEKIETILGTATGTAISRNVITDALTDIYTAFRKAPGVNLAFGGPDIRAINFLSGLDHFYTSSYLKNEDAQKVMRSFLKERYLENGAGIFGRGDVEDIAELRNLLGQKVADLEDWQIRRIVDTSVQRTRNWAAVTQMHEAGIQEIEIYEPIKDCALCRAMDGKIISVSAAYATMERQMEMTPEEYEIDIRSIAPLEMNVDELVEQGVLPPYHPFCRGMAIKRTK
jgi:phage gp29-like protein